MRVLLLMPSLTETGGAERMVDGLSRLLSSADVEAFEASFDPPGARRRLTIPHPSIPLGPVPRLPLAFRAFEYLVAARRLRSPQAAAEDRRHDQQSLALGPHQAFYRAASTARSRSAILISSEILQTGQCCDCGPWRGGLPALSTVWIAVNEALSRELAGSVRARAWPGRLRATISSGDPRSSRDPLEWREASSGADA
jgi:hypothetical protein